MDIRMTFEATVKFFGKEPVWLLFTPEERRLILASYR